jgi:hypothetical protein
MDLWAEYTRACKDSEQDSVQIILYKSSKDWFIDFYTEEHWENDDEVKLSR